MDATGPIPAKLRMANLRQARHAVSLRMLALAGSVLGWLAIFAIVLTVLILSARESVRNETGSAFRMANAFATRQLPTAFARRDMMADAVRVAAEIDGQRHLSAELRDSAGTPVPLALAPQPRPDHAPAWFAALIRPAPLRELIPIAQYPNVLGILEIRSDPRDEIAEAWADLRLLVPLLAAVALAASGLTLAITGLLRRRLALIGGALARMRAGDLESRAPQTGIAELATLTDGVNALAAHLARERAGNRHLQTRMMTLAEEERTRIASDLHDGIGPQLFALQAAVGQAGREGAGHGDAAGALAAISRHAQAIRQELRAAIDDLSLTPAEDADLPELLQELLIGFSDIAPQVRIDLELEPGLPVAGPAARIALFRFVRESVLNALRHAAPATIRVTLARDADGLLARVCDDGSGPPATARTGQGQSGMRDRAHALGGRYRPPARIRGRTVTEFHLPCPPDQGSPQ